MESTRNYEWASCQVISHYIPRVNRTYPPVFRCRNSYDMLYDLTFPRIRAAAANANSARVTHARSDIGRATTRWTSSAPTDFRIESVTRHVANSLRVTGPGSQIDSNTRSAEIVIRRAIFHFSPKNLPIGGILFKRRDNDYISTYLVGGKKKKKKTHTHARWVLMQFEADRPTVCVQP